MEKDHQQAIIGIKREHQLAITNNDTMIQAIQHEQVSLQGGIKNERQIVTDLIDNWHVSRTGKYENVLTAFEKIL